MVRGREGAARWLVAAGMDGWTAGRVPACRALSCVGRGRGGQIFRRGGTRSPERAARITAVG